MKVWEVFNIIPNNKKLYEQAFTHAKYKAEVDAFTKTYQRLEWFGDSVIKFKISKYIYDNCPKADEAKLSLLRRHCIKNEILGKISMQLKLIQFLKKGNSKDINSEKIHADIFESFIGALYLDNQDDVIEIIFKSTIYKIVDDFIKSPIELKNPKTLLQEKINFNKIKTKKEGLYITKNITQNPQNPLFESKVYLHDSILGTGKGKTKQKAEVAAAKDALSKMTK